MLLHRNIPALQYAFVSTSFTSIDLLFLSFLLRFTPEQLGLSASSLLVWLTIELLIIYLGLFLAQVTSQLSWMDLLAYCTYKYTRWVWF